MAAIDLKKFVRDIPDFPKPGIMFKDITPLLKNPAALKASVALLAKAFRNEQIKYVVAVESRGFIFASALACRLGAGFVPVRKKGKLPYKTDAVTYELEYGTDTLEIHVDAFSKGDRVLIVDDLLATGGTVEAVIRLVRGQSARIAGIGFIIELAFLEGRKKFKGYPVYSAIAY